MKLNKANLARYARHTGEIHRYFWYFLKCLFVLKRPLRFIRAYLFLRPFGAEPVELRSGVQLYLSGDPDEVATIFRVFVKEEYGEIPAGSTAVDIGANIGVFALFAASSKAARVLAYEPNSQAYECLLRNIQANHLEHIILARRLAVTGEDGDTVRFPARAGIHNAIITDGSSDQFELVQTINMKAIVRGIKVVDILKMNSEGAEYDTLLRSEKAVFEKIREIRMMYHMGREREIESYLAECGFKLRRHVRHSPGAGHMWFSKF